MVNALSVITKKQQSFFVISLYILLLDLGYEQ